MNDDFLEIEFKEFFDSNSRLNRIAHLESLSKKDFSLFDNAISKAEKEFTNKSNRILLKSEKLNKSLSESNLESDRVPSSKDLKIFITLFSHHLDHSLYSDYLTVLAEMKIIYLYKTLEINLKTLINHAYPNMTSRGLYQWENMITFYKSIGINISEISGYQEANDLRKVNNCIKHSDTINEEVKKIKEFNSLDYFDVDSINNFYNRIIKDIKIFFTELKESVIKDLFEFDKIRIENISEDYFNRMDKKTLKIFVETLNDKLSKKQ